MDQEPSARHQLAWWTEVVFHDWRNRPGPRYARLAAAFLEAIDRKTLREGTRVPAERTLAAAVGVSRGTVVACFDHLTAAGVLTRRQGDGTYVAGRPSWTATAGSVATALLRRIAAERETIDLSASSPGDLSHLPFPIPNGPVTSLDGHGLDPAGLPELRSAVARHLTEHQGLPTSPEQLVITNGAQEALWLLTRILPARTVLTSCPTYPGLTSSIGGSRAMMVPVPADIAGPDPTAIERAGRARGVRAGGATSGGRGLPPEGGTARAVAYLMPTGHNPTGAVMPVIRRQSLAALADAGRLTVVEDLALADLMLGDLTSGDRAPGDLTLRDNADATAQAPRPAERGPVAPPPLSALSSRVIAVGSASKLLWAGLRIGWIRVGDESLRGALIGRKAALNLATSAVSQSVTAQLLASVTPDWLAAHRAALTRRRDYLVALIGEQLPAWRVTRPEAGLSLWAELPLASADPFTHAAARHGVTITPGSTACVCGGHGNYVRLSFAEQPGTLELAAERLAAAWESHAQDLAATPHHPAHPDESAQWVQ
jgi:DNA-binding transcriptional MocR family regulator